MYLQTFKTIVKGDINKVLHETCVEDCHLVAGFENALAARSRFEREGSQNFFLNGQISSETFATSFLTPQCTFGTKETQKSHTGTPSKMVLFQKK